MCDFIAPGRRSAAAALVLAAAAGTLVTAEASAQQNPTWLQVFENEWDDIERRTADIWLARYQALWTPPPSKASFTSVGYDPFDRFDLGGPPIFDFSSDRARTTYGTEAFFRGMVEQLRRADIGVYTDAVLNHNGGRTTNEQFFLDGGWPGFFVPNEGRDKQPTDDWGDFHAGVPGGFLQSENPGAGLYDLFRGDLVSLVDIDQNLGLSFIRQPVEAGDPDNIPAGAVRNLPDAANARFYPDLSLTPDQFTNPATSRKGSEFVTRYPFNLGAPMSGDAVVETAGDLLARWCQWMLEVQGVAGFRLDAAKHMYPDWQDSGFDSAVFQNYVRPDGVAVTPFSFGESTTGNFDMLNRFTRRDGFGNRDSLDLNGAARLRELVNAGGFGSWDSVFSNADGGHLDQADDGLQNGTAGLFHVFSHDNGSIGDGGPLNGAFPSERQQGWFTHAYMLLRPGNAIVYHNARGVQRTNGFFPREGVPVALGWDPVSQERNDVILTLNKIRTTHAYGQYFQLNGNISDVLVYERRTPGGSNLIVAASDRYDSGIDPVTVFSGFPQGTRLVELTGNAADPQVDTTGQIPDVITVGADGQVNIAVPRNVSSAGEHNRGFVAYGPFVPAGELAIVDGDGETGVIPPDPASLPDFVQRLNAYPIVNGDTFDIELRTTLADELDGVTDDNALFRIDNGTQDWNGNGQPDFPYPQTVIGGFEQFTDVREPGMSDPGREGFYRQTIDATRLEEGFHYVRAIAFRQRPAGSTPLFNDFREAIFVDRRPVEFDIVPLGEPAAGQSLSIAVLPEDRTGEFYFRFLNPAPGFVPTLADLTPANAVTPYDRLEWRGSAGGQLVEGVNRVVVVAQESSGRLVTRELVIDLSPDCPADINGDGLANFGDVSAFIEAFNAGSLAADVSGDGAISFADVTAFITAFNTGCP